ncbi:MAG TPA: DUF4255 domain-containing protein [Phnomibacter sp.]|nr:DUF4255 domain-containing protein [Phnomibacter sp.]
MIDKALAFLAQEANAYFDARFGPSTQKWITLGNIAKLADAEAPGNGGGAEAANTLLGLVNIEEDRIAKNPENVVRTVDGIVYRNPKIHLNLYALFAVAHSNYPIALQTLATIIQCFQSQRVFDAGSHPGMDPALEKISLDLFTLNFEQVNHLWSTLGGKYLPSVLYKVRVVGIEDTERQRGGDLIIEIQINERMMKQ